MQIQKRAAVSLWTDHPCGSTYFGDVALTPEYFAQVEAHRYGEYAPWLKPWVQFDRYRGKAVLEVGCGMGTDALQFARAGAVYHGVDLTPRSIEITRSRFAWEGFAGEIQWADVEQLPFPDETFDLVFSNGVLHHVPDIQRAVDECRRVLRTGGTALVLLYHRRSLFYWAFLWLYHGTVRGQLRQYSLAQIAALQVESGSNDPSLKVAAYTRAEVRRMFAGFSAVSIVIRHLRENDLPWLPGILRRLPFLRRPVGALLNMLAPIWGWYLCIRATR